jgi:hypothetical protein
MAFLDAVEEKMNEKRFDDCDLVWACLRYCEGKHHIDPTFVNGVWEFMRARGTITDGQRSAILRFIQRERIDVGKWTKD